MIKRNDRVCPRTAVWALAGAACALVLLIGSTERTHAGQVCRAQSALVARQSIRFDVRCRGEFAIHRMFVTPSNRIQGFWRHATIHNRHDSREHMRCRALKKEGNIDGLDCRGWVRPGTLVRGRFSVSRKKRCSTAISFVLRGDKNCEPGQPCADVLGHTNTTARRPQGC